MNILWNLLQPGDGASSKKPILRDKKPSVHQRWLMRNVLSLLVMQGPGGGQCSKSALKNSHGICVHGVPNMPVPQAALLQSLSMLTLSMKLPSLCKCMHQPSSPTATSTSWLWNLLQSLLVWQHPCAIFFRAHTNSISVVTVIASNPSLLLNH